MNYLLTNQSEQDEKILVVDDSPDNLFLIQTILEEQGLNVILAQDGIAALKLVKEKSPKLILLDVMMPKMDGFEVTRQIRSNPNIPYIPILLITAYDQPSAVKGLDVGADDFIRKPVDVDELLARVRSLLRLKQSVDEREQMLRMREDFVSRLTHDLRTPLVAADRMLILMQDGLFGELSPEMKEALVTMARSNRNLLELVNNMLEVYRYEADSKIFNFTLVNLNVLVKEVIQELNPLVQEKGLVLNYEPVENLPYTVRGDRLELHRLFTNLIGNAIKFTDQGYIKIGLDSVTFPENSPYRWVVFTVEDTGIGISEQDQKWLFNRFRTGTHRRAGSGLGLHLCRQIVETHQGTIEVYSQLHQGSKFTVKLPQQN
ncbi:response regulator receiver sensor signal transduction histidine kinase [Gloeothece citriformis PCC 7424]|uniref:histidine kinase n=1 Tax=Gloeothece citriformis (strain PCC 7424) TaxID=65393 RepID=B7KDE5_GLOC7|nr:hybrid sensor histidine kinase/response regulator [Gloeothece citriformis]ACK68965.1 response regulator receiver sensor signal transduction histidine kinase [Gloeothece citriformis PCC 7424]